MSKTLYLINPHHDTPTYFGSEVFAATGAPPCVGMGDLPTTTVAAMAPPDFDVRICEELVETVDYDCGADFVGITGKISQWGRMRAIATEFRKRGTPVMIGGSFASLSPEVVAPYADILVCGEIEEIADDLFSDLRSGKPKERYVGTRPDLSTSPVPRWDLYPNHASFAGCIQTSRGCPFECEFCDVIQYVGRAQRHKPVENVLAEMDALYAHGYRTTYLADDNFTAYRRRTKELLRAICGWNERQQKGTMSFGTQVSIDVDQDEEVMGLLAQAGVNNVFIGIETVNEESLKEAKKRQNQGGRLAERVGRFYEYGIMPITGMIVGFDSDGPDIFERQYEFIMEASVPTTPISMLVAPAATPLHDRMKREGRLTMDGSEMVGSAWATNIIPKKMSQEELLEGLRWLGTRLYSPAAFGERLVRCIERLELQRIQGFSLGQVSQYLPRQVNRYAVRVAAGVATMGRDEAIMVARVMAAVARKPATVGVALASLYRYRQIRYMYDVGNLWEHRLVDAPKPVLQGLPALGTIGGAS
jgi:radical SAM superfamily enzyme YgiQ (UPF0313 family)